MHFYIIGSWCFIFELFGYFDFVGWKKRFCSLDKTGFKYYKSDNNSEVLGEFPVEEMLSVNICEDESAKDPQWVLLSSCIYDSNSLRNITVKVTVK